MRLFALPSLLLLSACAPGQLDAPVIDPQPPQAEMGPPDAGLDADAGADAAVTPDAAVQPDAAALDARVVVDPPDAAPVLDAQPLDQAPDPCPEGCGPNAECTPGGCVCDPGFVAEGAGCVPADPCDQVACEASARCVDGACVCRDGFVDDGAGGCQPAPVSPLEARSRDEVCARWTSFQGARQEWVPTPGAEGDPCDPGQTTPEGQDAAIARTNLYRWLTGLPPVGFDGSRVQAQQECAALMNALGSLTHHPDPNMPCYTAGAAQGAGSSNLALGANLSGSVDLYVGDRGVASLGHRRWVLNPGMQSTTFGIKGRASCMYSFSMGGPSRPEFVAWPPPGWVPTASAQGTASITLHSLRAGPDFRIEAAVEGALVDVGAERLGGNYGGGSTYAFTLPAGSWRDGAEMRVALRGLREHDDVLWTTRWTRCP